MNPFLDFFDLVRVGGGLLEEAVSNRRMRCCGRTYIVVLHGDHDRPEWWKHIRRILVISTAILAVPYAALQTDSLDDSGSIGAGSVGWRTGNDGYRNRLDEAASALWSFTRGWNVKSSCFMYSTIRGGGMGGGLFVGWRDFFPKVMHHGGGMLNHGCLWVLLFRFRRSHRDTGSFTLDGHGSCQFTHHSTAEHSFA